jgi:hypothetical protein
MKLDNTVCRGSLIFHNGIKYVALSLENAMLLSNPTTQAWRVIPVEDLKAGRVIGFNRFLRDEEVDMFFPGVVFPLPDYIR